MTGPKAGGTEITLTVNTSGSSSDVNFLDSDQITCQFPGTNNYVFASFLGYTDSTLMTSIIRCISPAWNGGSTTSNILVANWNDILTTSQDTGILYTYMTGDEDSIAVSPSTNWSISTNVPLLNLVPPARGPLFGGTEITIHGANMWPSDWAHCAFIEPVWNCTADWDCSYGWSCCQDVDGLNKCCKKSKAFFDSTEQYRCIAPMHQGIPTNRSISLYPSLPGFKGLVRISLVDANESEPLALALSFLFFFSSNQ